MRAHHRNGQRGTLGAVDGNGFAVFKSDTGARFSVHATEVHAEEPTSKERKAALERWAGWPSGTLRFKIERKSGQGKAFIVARTHIAQSGRVAS